MELEQLTRDSFAPLLDTSFEVALVGSPALDLKLASIGTAGAGLPGVREPFSLIFHGPLAPTLPQGTFTLAHATLGQLSIFIVPIGPLGAAMRYEAIFS
ncbi:MAG: hypothetical protein ABI609_05165 [Acidobacteriota bacterium]